MDFTRAKTNVTADGEIVYEWRLKKPKGLYSLAEVYDRAEALRQKLLQEKSRFKMAVAVRDKKIAGWRGGKPRTLDQPIYIYSQEEYDKEFNDGVGAIDLGTPIYEGIVLYSYKI